MKDHKSRDTKAPFLVLVYFCLFTESGPNAASHKEVMKLRKDNQILTEENNFLKLKVDLLLDMVNKHIKFSCFF